MPLVGLPLVAFPLSHPPALAIDAKSVHGGDLPAQMMSQAPIIDGIIHKSEWAEAAHGEDFFNSEDGSPSPDKGEFWIGYDDKNIYVAGRFHTDPRKVVADEYRLNMPLTNNDHMTFAIDPSGGLGFSQFSFNASGASQINLSGGRAAKTEWLGQFETQGHLTSDGWEVEARIPWSVLPKTTAGTRDCRFNVAWQITSRQDGFVYKFANEGPMAYPKLTGMKVPEVEQRRSVQLLPYTYLGIDNNNQAISAFGLDAKTSLGSGMELVGTINPDFRNIENNILSLDFSHVPRLAAEARPFFQEGASYLRVGQYQKTFASQNIADIDYGLNLYGSPDPKTQVGLLTTVNIGQQQAIVGSIQQQPTPAETWQAAYVGDLEPGIRNHATNLSYDVQRGNWNTFGGIRTSQDLDTKTGMQTDFNVTYNYNGVFADVGETSVSADFNPRLGFTPELDFLNAYTDWGISRQFKHGGFNSDFHVISFNTANHLTQGFYKNSVNTYNQWVTKNSIELGAYFERSSFEDSHDQAFTGHITFPAGNPYRYVMVQIDRSRFSEIPYNRFSINSAYKPSKRVQLALTSEWVDYGGAETQIIGSITADKGRFESYGLRLIRRDSSLDWSLTYRMSGGPGPEYYIAIGDPNADTFQRQLVIKAIVPIELRI